MALKEQTQHRRIFWTRIESSATVGVPDLYGVVDLTTFWLELKVITLKQAQKLSLRPHQIAWHYQHSLAGGRSFILAHHPPSSSLLLWPSSIVLLPELPPPLRKYPSPTGRWRDYPWDNLIDDVISLPVVGPLSVDG